MNKLSFKYLFIVVFSSLFLFNFNVFAVEQYSLDNYTYYYYFNFYSMQFDNREVAQRYFTFFKSIDFDLYNYVLDHISSSTLSRYSFNKNDNYYIRVVGLNSQDNIYSQYDYTSGIDFILNTGVNSGSSCNMYITSNGTAFKLKRNYIQSCGGTSIRFNLKVDYLGNPTLTLVDYAYDKSLELTFDNPIHLLSYFFQSNFYLNYKDGEANRPVGFTNIKFFSDSSLYTSKDYKYLGYEYFDNHLYFGAGSPLYPGRNYFINKFEFGDPYNDKYGLVYTNSSSVCTFAPTSILLSDYENIHSSNLEQFYIKNTSNSLSTKFNYSVHVFRDKTYYSRDFDPNNYDSDNIRYNLLSGNGNLSTFNPRLFGNDSLVRVEAHNDTNTSVAIYYNKKYWNYSCSSESDKSFKIINSEGEELEVFPGNFNSDNGGIFSFFESIVDFVYKLINILISLFNKLIESVKSLFIYINESISTLNSFNDFFVFVGSSITLFYSLMPAVVIKVFNVILVLSGVILIFRIINS